MIYVLVILTAVHVRDSTNIPFGDITIETISFIKHCTCCTSVEKKRTCEIENRKNSIVLNMMDPILRCQKKNDDLKMINVLSNPYCDPWLWQHSCPSGRDQTTNQKHLETLHVLYKCWNKKWLKLKNRKKSNVLMWRFLFFGIKKRITIKKWSLFE